jgi:hypothetical protein
MEPQTQRLARWTRELLPRILILLSAGSASEGASLYLPNRDTILAGSPLPIDGTWIMNEEMWLPDRRGTVRMEKGRAFYLDMSCCLPGEVYVKNLKKFDATRYTGTALIPSVSYCIPFLGCIHFP